MTTLSCFVGVYDSDPEVEEPQLTFDKGYVPQDERFSDIKKGSVYESGNEGPCKSFLCSMDAYYAKIGYNQPLVCR